MAEVDTQLLSTQHSDIRREQAEQASNIRRENAEHYGSIQLENMKGFDRVNADVLTTAGIIRAEGAAHTGEIVKEGLKESFAARGDIKDTRYDIASRMSDNTANLSQQIDRIDDTTMAQFMTLSRDTSDLKAQVVHAISNADKAAELNALKTQIEGQRNTTYLSDKISNDGDRTRGLINDLKYHDLNRALVERNAELVEERHFGRHWRGVADQNQFGAQFAQLQSMMQNFNSQLADTRQSMVNFGTMAGVGQTSTANNVR